MIRETVLEKVNEHHRIQHGLITMLSADTLENIRQAVYWAVENPREFMELVNTIPDTPADERLATIIDETALSPTELMVVATHLFYQLEESEFPDPSLVNEDIDGAIAMFISSGGVNGLCRELIKFVIRSGDQQLMRSLSTLSPEAKKVFGI